MKTAITAGAGTAVISHLGEELADPAIFPGADHPLELVRAGQIWLAGLGVMALVRSYPAVLAILSISAIAPEALPEGAEQSPQA